MKSVEWSEHARADLRSLDRPIAVRVLKVLTRFAENGEGDVRKLRGDTSEFRLRVGDWRVRFGFTGPNVIRVYRILHRSKAYR